MTGLIDISPPLRVGMGVFPGDASFETSQTFTIGPGCPVNVAEHRDVDPLRRAC